MLKVILIVLAVIILVKVCNAETPLIDIPNRQVELMEKHGTKALDAAGRIITDTKINGVPVKTHTKNACHSLWNLTKKVGTKAIDLTGEGAKAVVAKVNEQNS